MPNYQRSRRRSTGYSKSVKSSSSRSMPCSFNRTGETEYPRRARSTPAGTAAQGGSACLRDISPSCQSLSIPGISSKASARSNACWLLLAPANNLISTKPRCRMNSSRSLVSSGGSFMVISRLISHRPAGRSELGSTELMPVDRVSQEVAPQLELGLVVQCSTADWIRANIKAKTARPQIAQPFLIFAPRPNQEW